MSKLDEKIALYTKAANDLGLGLDEALIAAATKGLGPSIHKKDAETVSCTDSSELERVKQNFLIKKLGLEDSKELDEAIKSVCEKMGSSNRTKYRALFYALLAQAFNKESVYA